MCTFVSALSAHPTGRLGTCRRGDAFGPQGVALQATAIPRVAGLSRSLLIFASGGCAVILCDSLGGRLLLGFEITEG